MSIIEFFSSIFKILVFLKPAFSKVYKIFNLILASISYRRFTPSIFTSTEKKKKKKEKKQQVVYTSVKSFTTITCKK